VSAAWGGYGTRVGTHFMQALHVAVPQLGERPLHGPPFVQWQAHPARSCPWQSFGSGSRGVATQLTGSTSISSSLDTAASVADDLV
jgi:hypothetical protein